MIEVEQNHQYYGICGLSFKSKNFDQSCESSRNCQVDLMYQGTRCDDIDKFCPPEYKPRDFVRNVNANCECSTDGTSLRKCSLMY